MADEKAAKTPEPENQTPSPSPSQSSLDSETLLKAQPGEISQADEDSEDDEYEDDEEYDEDDYDEDDEEYEEQAGGLNQADLYAQLSSNPIFAQVSQMLGGMGSEVDQKFTQARMLQASGDLEGAAQLYLDVIEQHPDHFKAHEALGQVLLAMDKPQEAETFLNRAVELDPNDPSGYLYLGYAHYAQKQFDKCIEDFKRTVELDPQNGLAANNLGYAYYLAGQLDEAADTFTLAGDWGSDRAYYNLGMIRLLQGRDKDAATAYQDALDLDPRHNQIEDHLADLEAAAEKSPDHAEALNAQAERLREEL